MKKRHNDERYQKAAMAYHQQKQAFEEQKAEFEKAKAEFEELIGLIQTALIPKKFKLPAACP